MANPEHLRHIMPPGGPEGVIMWNQWWDSERAWALERVIDLSGVDFSGQDLRGIYWNYNDYRPINHFEGCNFEGCDFSYFPQDFRPDARGGRRPVSILNGGIFTNANFRNADLRGANMPCTLWDNANLEGALFDERSNIPSADFSRALNVPVSVLLCRVDIVHQTFEQPKFPPYIIAQMDEHRRKQEVYAAARSLEGIIKFLKH